MVVTGAMRNPTLPAADGPANLLSAVRVTVRPAKRRHVSLPDGGWDRPVALYAVGLGNDGRMLPEIGRLGYEGLLVETLGGGHVPSGRGIARSPGWSL